MRGAAAVVDKLIKFKTRKRGLTSSQMCGSLFAMWAAGGDRCEDFEHFRQDRALPVLLGHELPAPQTARDFLDQFHEDGLPLLQEGKAALGSLAQLADITTRPMHVVFVLVNAALLKIERRGDAPPLSIFIAPNWVPICGLITSAAMLIADLLL